MKAREEMERIFRTALGREETTDRGLKVYRDLVKTRIEEVLSSSFPLFKRFVGDLFEDLVSEFISFPHRSPFLTDLTGEFVEFFRSKEMPLKRKLPFLEDVLLYEWFESLLVNAPEEGTSTFSWEGRYRLSSSSRLVRFRYPVHRADSMELEELLKKEGSYHLLLFRDPEDFLVRQVELTEFVYDFLCKVGKGEKPMETLSRITPGDIDPKDLKPYLERFMQDLCSKGVLVSCNFGHS